MDQAPPDAMTVLAVIASCLLVLAFYFFLFKLLLVLLRRMRGRMDAQKPSTETPPALAPEGDVLRLMKSKAVLRGRVVEQLAPFFPDFPVTSLQAIVFIGGAFPADYLVLDMEGGKPVVKFIEVKAGEPTLSQRERWVRDAVEAGNVRWVVYSPNLNRLKER